MQEQKYYIVEKIEWLNGQLVSSIVGYILSESDADQINVKYNSYALWIRDNRVDLVSGAKSVSEYLVANGPVYDAATSTTNIDGLGLSLVTDITPYI